MGTGDWFWPQHQAAAYLAANSNESRFAFFEGGRHPSALIGMGKADSEGLGFQHFGGLDVALERFIECALELAKREFAEFDKFSSQALCRRHHFDRFDDVVEQT